MTQHSCSTQTYRCTLGPAALRRWLAAPVLCLSVGLPAYAASAGDITPSQHYQLALEARTMQDYAGMLSHLRQAAEAGDLGAQELLGSLLVGGTSLSGGAIAANPCEAAQWAQRAAAQGSAVARHQRAVLNGLRDLPQGRDHCARN